VFVFSPPLSQILFFPFVLWKTGKHSRGNGATTGFHGKATQQKCCQITKGKVGLIPLHLVQLGAELGRGMMSKTTVIFTSVLTVIGCFVWMSFLSDNLISRRP